LVNIFRQQFIEYLIQTKIILINIFEGLKKKMCKLKKILSSPAKVKQTYQYDK